MQSNNSTTLTTKEVETKINKLLNLAPVEATVEVNRLNEDDKHHYKITFNPKHTITAISKKNLAKKLDSIGAKFILTRPNVIYFSYSENNEQTKNIDVSKYKPTKIVLSSLQGYLRYGLKLDLQDINDVDKLLVYYYGSKLLHWNELAQEIKEWLPTELTDTLDMIDKEVMNEFNTSNNKSISSSETPSLKRGDKISFGMTDPNYVVTKQSGDKIYFMNEYAGTSGVQSAHKSNISIIIRNNEIVWQDSRHKIQQGNYNDI